MLSPTSLSGLASGPGQASRVRAVSPPQGPSAPMSPIAPLQRAAPHGSGQTEGQPSRTLPRGSLLDLSV